MPRLSLQFWLGLGLVGITLAGLGGVCANGFVNFDDNEYVYDNEKVQAGLTPAGVWWAFTTFHSANWHPLTWISLQLDAQLYGVQRPWGFHLTNLALHVANTLLLFWVLRRMTGATARSALVAALFAVHPLHVESVAWVAERKDVLSTLFWMLGLVAYARYVEHPGLGRYLLVLSALALGLAAKPMLVTAPFLLLLLDYWPLGRWRIAGNAECGMRSAESGPMQNSAFPIAHSAFPIRRLSWLLLEKLPLFALAAASAWITLRAQGQAVVPLEHLSIEFRIANALAAYVGYIGKMFWPAGLAVLYPHPRVHLPGWQAAGAFLVLAILSALVLAAARRKPYLLVGWLWFLGTLVPVLGLVQVGNHAMADRFTYMPLVGLFVLLVWGCFDLTARFQMQIADCRLRIADLNEPFSFRFLILKSKIWNLQSAILPVLAGMVLLSCVIGSRMQTSYWRDSITLWQRAVAVTTDNAIAHRNLAIALWVEGERDEAIPHFAEVFRIRPDIEARDNLQALYYVRGNDYDMQGRLDEAFRRYQAAAGLNPNNAAAHNAMGTVRWRQGRLDQAAAHYHDALRALPTYKEAHYNLGVLLMRQGKLPAARCHFSETLRIDPRFAPAHDSLATSFALEEKWSESVACRRQAVDLQPANAQFLAALALAYGEKGETDMANTLYRQALQLDPGWPAALNRDAWALATHPDRNFRHGVLALLLAKEVCQASRAARHGRVAPQFLDTLAAAYAEAGRWEDAVKTGLKAQDRARSVNDDELARRIEDRIRLYRLKQPFREKGFKI
jgi:tetratricopeptide (TPR) repeat protein